jgi:hypothetical protein
MINRLANFGLLLLAFKPALEEGLRGNVDVIIEGYTAGLSKGRFSRAALMRWYGPVAAAFILFEVKKMAMKKFGRLPF